MTFVLPPYPYDRLDELRAVAAQHKLGMLDLSIGTPVDPAADVVAAAMADPSKLPGYPPSVGTPEFRSAAARWLSRRFDIDANPEMIGACIGTKELVVGLPHWLSLRSPERDTVLYPGVSYPSYAMGAELAGCRAVPVAMDENWSIDLESIDPADAARALCLWVNTPGNPAGGLDDLEAVVEWGRTNEVLVASDECYIEFTWDGAPRSALTYGNDGVLAVHSLSKRSNLAGGRLGFYTGDTDVTHYLREIRKHAGFMVPGPLQAAGAVAFDDDAHVDEQRSRYQARLALLAATFARHGVDARSPRGGFYLWTPAPEHDGWAFAQRLAQCCGIVGSPGEFYGPSAVGYVRLAVVATDESFATLPERFDAAVF
ncbi:MAG: aminotransferase class I/II-fold pyridoxal phosphate-dependent enzyme [Acidobacteria bacterium]|nr:aminotransferase class I/II-fold pyridoxal phosphate-dependent enzyme [Acidobacteriota bacterium]